MTNQVVVGVTINLPTRADEYAASRFINEVTDEYGELIPDLSGASESSMEILRQLVNALASALSSYPLQGS